MESRARVRLKVFLKTKKFVQYYSTSSANPKLKVVLARAGLLTCVTKMEKRGVCVSVLYSSVFVLWLPVY